MWDEWRLTDASRPVGFKRRKITRSGRWRSMLGTSSHFLRRVSKSISFCCQRRLLQFPERQDRVFGVLCGIRARMGDGWRGKASLPGPSAGGLSKSDFGRRPAVHRAQVERLGRRASLTLRGGDGISHGARHRGDKSDRWPHWGAVITDDYKKRNMLTQTNH